MTSTRNMVLSEVKVVAERFLDSGYSIYLVGGIVRDLALGAGIGNLDFDLTTNARPQDIRRLMNPIADELWAQGERFGTIGCRIAGREYEITTHRAEWYSDESRKPQVAFGDEVEVDLSRRDFTINAMAIELPGGRLVDPFDGSRALRARQLITPVDPQVSFADDPLRILRAARFIARYELEVASGVEEAATRLVGRLEIVSAERIRDELDKLLATERPSAGLAFLQRVGALSMSIRFLPLDQLDRLGGDLDRSASSRAVRRLLVFSRCAPADREEQIAALRYSNREQRAMLSLLAGFDVVEAHDGPWIDSEVRRLVDRVGHGSMDELFGLLDGRNSEAVPALRSSFERLDASETLASFTPVLAGEEIMDLLDLVSGPAVGRAFGMLRRRRIEHGPATADEERIHLLENWER